MDDEDPDTSFKFNKITKEDKTFLAKLLKNPHIAKNFIKGTEYIDEEIDQIMNNMIRCWEANELGFYTVEYNQQQIGIAGFNYLTEFEQVEIVYCLDEVFWGKGLAVPMVNSLINIGFNELKLSKILGIVKKNNIPSYKVLEKNKLIKIKEFNEKNEDYYLLEINNSQGRKKLIKTSDVGL